MVYAKFENEQIVFAPRKVTIGGETVKFPTEEQLFALGFLRVVFTPQTEAPDGYAYEATWEEINGEIVQVWSFAPLPDDIDEAEAYDIIFGGGGE